MRRIEKLIKQLRDRLQREFSGEYHPAEYRGRLSARIVFPARVQLEPILKITESGKDFSLFFCILNRKLAFRYGICSDDPIAVLRGTCGYWQYDQEKLLAHIRESLSWLDQQTENNAEIPEERKFDGMTDLLSRLDPELLRYGWHRHYTHTGNWQQRCDIPLLRGGSGSIEMTFGKEHWQLFFELLLYWTWLISLPCISVSALICELKIVRLSMSETIMPSNEEIKENLHQFELHCDYTPASVSQIADHINQAMQWLNRQRLEKTQQECHCRSSSDFFSAAYSSQISSSSVTTFGGGTKGSLN